MPLGHSNQALDGRGARIRRVARRPKESRFSPHSRNLKVKTPIKGVLLSVLRGADDVRTYWQITKEWFEVPVLAGRC